MNIPEMTNEVKQGARSESVTHAPAMDRPPGQDGSVKTLTDAVNKYSQAEADKNPNNFSRETVESLVADIEKKVDETSVQLKFNVLEENDTIQVEIVDSEGKTIRKIPGDDLLKLSQSLKNLDRGFLDEIS